MATTSIVIMIIVALLVLAVGFLLVPYLKQRGYLNQQSVDVSKQILNLVKLVLRSVEIDNQGIKDEATIIFNVSDKVVKFIEQTMNVDHEQKKSIAVATITDILKSLNIQLNDDNKRLIEIGIESAVNVLPKTNK